MAVQTAFALSCIFGLLIADVGVAAFVACLPVRGKHSRNPTNHLFGFLAELIENVFDVL